MGTVLSFSSLLRAISIALEGEKEAMLPNFQSLNFEIENLLKCNNVCINMIYKFLMVDRIKFYSGETYKFVLVGRNLFNCL